MSKVSLNGYVIPSDDQWIYDWFGISAFSPATVRQALENNPEGEELEVEINSGGGSVFAGFEIYSLLYAAKCPTVAIVQSLAGSAASTVMSGCKRVLMTPVAQVMIHLPTSYAEGNQNDMKHEAKVLESITQSILNGYLVHCGGKSDRAKLEKLMHSESWITAQEAVDLGLADGILGDEESAGQISAAIVNSVGSGIRALATNNLGPLPTQDLVARYEQMVKAGAAPADGHPVEAAPAAGTEEPNQPQNITPSDPAGEKPEQPQDDWRVKARLDIERNRYTNIIKEE